MNTQYTNMVMSHRPQIVITEQPKQRGMRFRYECEGRSAGSIPGVNTNSDRKTWPTIQVINYTGEVVIRVSLVSKDTPPRPHPHSLVGKDCSNGICQVRVNPETQMTACFSNLGIQCVKRKEVSGALQERQKLGVDPFNTFKDSDPQAVDIDLNIVRLCFEAFISQGNQHLVLDPVLSKPIFDKKATCSALLRICRVDKSFGSCKGGDEVYLLCDKVQKDDISICFFEVETGWESYGEFSPTDVHRQVAIVFRTPPYKNQQIREATKVFFQLKRSSDGETSDSKDFTYLPLQHEQPHINRNHPQRRVDQSLIRTNQILQDHIHRKAETHSREPYLSAIGGPQPGKRARPSFPDPPSRMMPDAFPAVLDKFLKDSKYMPAPYPSSSRSMFSPSSPAPVYPSTDNRYSHVQMQPLVYNPNTIFGHPTSSANPQQTYTPLVVPQLEPAVTQMGQPDPNEMSRLNTGLLSSQRIREGQNEFISQPDLGMGTPSQRGIGEFEEINATIGFDLGIESLGSLRDVSLNVDDELGAEMKQMSIEENISLTDLVKPEPTQDVPFPNPNPPTTTLAQYPQQAPPIFDIQAPSPLQFQAPPPPYHRPSEQSQERPQVVHNQLTSAYEIEQSIPSFDLNDPQGQFSLDASQNDIEDMMKNNPN
ncbi:dorsal-related immunity factor Dif-like [Styela clava]|uniref:putative transcription factor p65 homolog n=1 Tax=Styela clava TaxID=7725 RepID=UPI001939BD8B|nr:putative transcription factor p65 homolog [Styela clava]